MTPQQIVGLALRLTSLWLVLLAFQLCALTASIFDFIKEDVSIMWLAFAMLPAVFGILMWMFPMLLAQKLLPQKINSSAAPIQEAAAVALIVLGILVVLKAVPTLFSGILMTIVGQDMRMAHSYFQGGREIDLIISILQYALGLCLLCTPRLIARRIFPAPSTDRKTA